MVHFILLQSEQHHEIVEFAQQHSWCLDNGDKKWNVFNNGYDEKCLRISHNMSDENSRGDICAYFRFVKDNSEDSMYKVFWEPGKYFGSTINPQFDNDILWTGDYSQQWFYELLDKAHKEYNLKTKYTKNNIGKRVLSWLKNNQL